MTDELVIDASALVKALVQRDDDAIDLGMRLRDADLHAPHLVDAELGDVLRRLVVADRLHAETATTALLSMDSLIDERYPHAGPLTRGAWGLRDRVRFYDALYVALAARLDLPLVTADTRLSRAHDLPCEVQVV
ncbi:MAG: PIN domain-containing protein [Actinophytocola sp.]|nr:PIN domain-containing protein [Actinophytocola sp.]